MPGYVILIVVDIAVIASLSTLIGLTAPRWPDSWLDHDSWLTRPRWWETPPFYRRLRTSWWAARLPECGSIFGGRSKRHLPGRDPVALGVYLIEVRRAIWVHSLSLLTWLPLLAFNPWWLSIAGLLFASAINVPFLVILRGNNARVAVVWRSVSGVSAAESNPDRPNTNQMSTNRPNTNRPNTNRPNTNRLDSEANSDS